MAHSIGSNIGPYRVVTGLGRGGMASVYKAYEPSLDRHVALKVLPPEFLRDAAFAARFRREAQTVARLEHPQIIPIFAYDIDAKSGTPWMAMRLISGGSLARRIKRGRLAPSECARILKDVADALDYAHAAGVIHRDVKPQNVLLDDAGRVYLADFGIARMVEGNTHMTQTGMIMGTPQYMAPEQVLDKPIDKAIDIYALGIVAYELFTGRVPFSADTPVEVLMKQTTEPMPVPPLSEVREEVTQAILRATAKDPAARWPSASAFARAIVSATTAEAESAPAAAAAPPATVAGTAQGTAMVAGAGHEAERATPSARPLPLPAAPHATQAGTALRLISAILLAFALMATGAAYLQSYLSGMNASVSPTDVGSAPPKRETEPATSGMQRGRPETPSVAPVYAAAGNPETEAKTKAVAPGPGIPASALGERPEVPLSGPALTRIRLEIAASQPSTEPPIDVLFGEILIDSRPYRRFTIRFGGGNASAHERKVENIVLDGVPVSAREITVAVATDSAHSSERVEGSARLSLRGEERNLAVSISYGPLDKSVKFR